MKRLLPLLVISLAGGLSSLAQDSRTWTDTKGRTLEGTLVKQNDSTVWVQRDNGTRVAIPKETLSEDDQKHLKQAATARASLKGERFDTSRIDPSAWKPRPTGLRFGKLVYPATLESPHFIVGGEAKIRPALLASYAEAAERLWTDIAADYPGLAEAFKGKKMPIILVDGKDQAKTFATWHQDHAQASRKVAYSYRLLSGTIVPFSLDEEFADEAGLTGVGRLFRLDAKKADHNRVTWPERIHFLSEDILRQWIGSPDTNNGASFSIMKLVFSYHREEIICGKIESEVSFGGGSDVEGFRNGRNWSGATKKLLKKGATPDIEEFLEIPAPKAQPRDLGVGHGLMHFIQAEPDRLTGFGKLLAEIAESDDSPDGEALAGALGFDSTDELNAAWLEYMESDAYE